ncbi:hypothetical protein [Clostridium sp. UBA4395]|uniref:hypothetical protein n=1 Tax=Clostridium sp. UBA4395 TaxID=1946360 RepID=UPI003216C038
MNNKEITYREAKNCLESYLHNNRILANLIPDLNSLTEKTIDALENEDEEVFDLYFKRLCGFAEKLKKYMEV